MAPHVVTFVGAAVTTSATGAARQISRTVASLPTSSPGSFIMMVAAFAETMSNYREIRPSPRLARYVECYWHRDDRLGTPLHSVLPDACVDILFSRRGSEPVSLSIVGLMTSPLTLDIVPGQFFFGVRFRAGMAGSFLPEIASLIDQTVPVAEIMGAAGRTLFEQFAESSG